MLNLLLVPVIIIGLFFGLLLKKVTGDETVIGRKYLVLLKLILLLILILTIIFLLPFNYLFLLPFIVGFIAYYLIKSTYFYLGLLLVVALELSNEVLIFIASIIFIYSLVYPSLLTKNIKKILTINIALFLLPLVLLFSQILTNYNDFVLAFVLGGLLSNLLLGFKARKK